MDDAARALGYVHASERLYQMEMQRRAGQGRVAEIAGADFVGVDRFVRTLGFYRLAESSFAALSPWAQSRLQAYADGVNAFLDSSQERATAGVLDPRRRAGALEACGHAGVGQTDVVGAQRQLQARGVARPSPAETVAGTDGLALRHADGRFADHHRSRPQPAARRVSTTSRVGSPRSSRCGAAPRTNGWSPARGP